LTLKKYVVSQFDEIGKTIQLSGYKLLFFERDMAFSIVPFRDQKDIKVTFCNSIAKTKEQNWCSYPIWKIVIRFPQPDHRKLKFGLR
jgi:hypothetical protein